MTLAKPTMAKRSMLGATYPQSPSNLTTAAVINNRRGEQKIKAGQIDQVKHEDIAALSSEIFSIGLIVMAYVNGELDLVDLKGQKAIECIEALRVIANTDELEDEAFVEAFQKIVYLWPSIIETDYELTNRMVEKTRLQLSDQAGNEAFEVSSSVLKNHTIDSIQAADLMTSMVHYAVGLKRKASDQYSEVL